MSNTLKNQGQNTLQASAPESPSILTTLLGSTPLADFLEHFYRRSPFYRQGGCCHLRHLGSWEALQTTINRDTVYSHPGLKTNARGLVESLVEVRALMKQGYNVANHNVENRHAGLANLAGAFRRDFGDLTDVSIFCTGTDQPGAAWHTDEEDVFVLQTVGAKEWNLQEDTKWHYVHESDDEEERRSGVIDYQRFFLHEGDWLYVPSGYLHRTRGIRESVSLSINVHTSSGLSVTSALWSHLMRLSRSAK